MSREFDCVSFSASSTGCAWPTQQDLWCMQIVQYSFTAKQTRTTVVWRSTVVIDHILNHLLFNQFSSSRNRTHWFRWQKNQGGSFRVILISDKENKQKQNDITVEIPGQVDCCFDWATTIVAEWLGNGAKSWAYLQVRRHWWQQCREECHHEPVYQECMYVCVTTLQCCCWSFVEYSALIHQSTNQHTDT